MFYTSHDEVFLFNRWLTMADILGELGAIKICAGQHNSSPSRRLPSSGNVLNFRFGRLASTGAGRFSTLNGQTEIESGLICSLA
jgi:hypothetical protein